MTRDVRSRFVLASTVVLALGAGCGTAPSDPSQSTSSAYRWKAPPDAAPSDDAGAASGDDAAPPTGGSGGSVACFTAGNPTATCAAPDHCCFTNYDASHNGYCTTDPCPYGTIDCDGPEDCRGGDVCCARALTDPDFGTYGYAIACQSAPCIASALVHELCHADAPGDCTDPQAACVPARGNDDDLPAVLSICQ